MYWKLRIGHKSRCIVSVILVFCVICVVFRAGILLFTQHYSTSHYITEYGFLRGLIGKQTTGELHVPRYTRLPLSSPTKRAESEADRVTEQEKVRAYYKLRSVKTDHCNFTFLIKGSSICQERIPFLLILVPSLPYHYYNRQVIRETWGQFARNKTVDGSLGSKHVKLAFLLGRWADNKTRHAIIQEKNEHSDIVVGDFEDSYKNLTRKILFGLKWMSIYCGEADYILKVDEDIYVNIPKLVDILAENPANMTGSIYGHLYNGGHVERQGRWAVSKEEFPLSNYPPYMSGNSYVISGVTAPKFLYTSQYLPYHPIEDAFITGVLPRVNEISQFHVDGFTSWRDASPDPCTFFSENKISGNKVNPDLMKKLWLTQNSFRSVCAINKL